MGAPPFVSAALAFSLLGILGSFIICLVFWLCPRYRQHPSELVLFIAIADFFLVSHPCFIANHGKLEPYLVLWSDSEDRLRRKRRLKEAVSLLGGREDLMMYGDGFREWKKHRKTT